ncbi:MAG: tRNA (adenosine(37)-N6)-dimethylallyltransferase MiaA [Rhodospirillaceae bacterium]|nr:tRNA (adenosine(37)-N6)-dimethylallyltransferase MiaA [Rhodospirillaceae bacterium]MDD9999414.1 tRNA (adenosine(37)-N6)-dimethylallyltransferase MiaA [Rhodospirillaceae bacterium]MDE0360722.1 tRNA (adenosine(37)-N6)-dimethylallyltransferase MiaA [Rhodospirillaceae bacterium]
MNDGFPPCVCITGPTACGKTDLALALAEQFPLEVISMDSAMVYRGMDIGTAKPSPDILAEIPHHLVDILAPTESYSAGRFSADAQQAVERIRSRGRLPVLVGGTLLYLRALRDGLSSLPRANPAIRRRLDREAELFGWEGLYRRLEKVDPAVADRISPKDRQRIQRALEVYELTGEPISALQSRERLEPGMPVRAVALVPSDRGRLAERIERRFDAMVEAGFVDEVRALRERGDLDPAMTSMRTIGYRQVWSHLDGDCDWPEARGKAIAATRQLAKRQLTWLRSDKATRQLPADAPGARESIARLVNEYGGN